MDKKIQFKKISLTQIDRAKLKNQKPMCLWLTGLSGSGKTTLANALEKELYKMKKHAYILDGDNLRHGLNSDLNFSKKNRNENVLLFSVDKMTENCTCQGKYIDGINNKE